MSYTKYKLYKIISYTFTFYILQIYILHITNTCTAIEKIKSVMWETRKLM